MKKNRGQPPKAKPQKRSQGSRSIAVRVPVAAHASLKKIAQRHDLSVNALLNYYIQQIVEHETDSEPGGAAADPLPASAPAEEVLPAAQGNFAGGSGIRYEKVGITSPLFARMYYKSYIMALVCTIVLTPIPWLIKPYPIIVLIVPILSILGSIAWIIRGSVRKDGAQIISGWAWLAGLLSILVAGVALFLVFSIFGAESKASVLLGILACVVFVGLLVNAPVEVSLALNKKRTKDIHAHSDEWGKAVCDLLLQHEIQPEMTKEMVLLSWGKPTLIESQEVTKGNLTEEWVYRSTPKTMYVWFTNGLVSKVNDFGA